METGGGPPRLLIENDRLRAEVALLRAELRDRGLQVASMESSRWWRLNPRRVLARGRTRRSASAVPAVTPETAVAVTEGAPPAADVKGRFEAEVISRGRFSQEWFTRAIEAWEPVMAGLEGRPLDVLEIGSFEGMSACFVLWRLPQAQITCVDTFGGSMEHGVHGFDTAQIEEAFDANVALVDRTRVRKLRGDSKRVLLDLIAEGARYDFVYIDGSHEALDVLVDGALAWRLLDRDGVMVFDDYGWAEFDDPLLRPAPAVDRFVDLVADRSVQLFDGYQYALRKLGDVPPI